MYKPKVDFYGTDIVVIEVEDLGNAGKCYDQDLVEGRMCSLKDEFHLPVLVSAKEDKIEIISPYKDQLVFGFEDREVILSSIHVKNHDLNQMIDDIKESSIDPRFIIRNSSDNFNSITNDHLFNATFTTSNTNTSNFIKYDPLKLFQMEIKSTQGTISLGQQGSKGCIFSIGDGSFDSHMVFTANVGSINDAINTLHFFPVKNFNSWDVKFSGENLATVYMKITGSKSAIYTSEIKIAVQPVNDMPTLSFPGEVYSQMKQEDPFNLYVSSINTVYINEDEEYYLSGVFNIFYTYFPSHTHSLSLSLSLSLFLSYILMYIIDYYVFF